MSFKPFLTASRFTVGGYRGDVVGSKTWGETHVYGSSSGGGGYINNGSGHLSSPSMTVSSTVVTRNTLFLKLPNGREEKISYVGSFGTRDGHEVSAIFVSFDGDTSGYLLRLENHSTGEIDEFPSSITKVIPWYWRLRQFGLCAAVVALLFMQLPGAMTGEVVLAVCLLAAILCWPLLVIERRRVRKAVLANARQEPERLVKAAQGTQPREAAPAGSLLKAHAQ